MVYGMFTEEGNTAVNSIVSAAVSNGWDWKKTYGELKKLATTMPQSYGEAMDTEVRQCVYYAIGAAERYEDFWV
jgi:hypothetical protein